MQKNFSYPLIVEDIAAAEKKYRLTADAADLKELAEILQIPSVKSFSAEIYTKMNKKEHLLRVWGRVKAELELQSVVRLYDTKATPKSRKEEEISFEDDLPDIVIDGQIDLGQIAIEQIALAMEDYPRKEGEVFSWKSEFDPQDDERRNPFKILEKLKK